jgi:allophanate hydrolase
MPTGSALRFAAVTRDQAEEIWIAHCHFLRGLRDGLQTVPDGAPDTAYLLSCDLVGLFAADEILAPVLRADSAAIPT